jgi:hypothetical protein
MSGPRLFSAVVLVVLIVTFAVSNGLCQIGNLDWYDGREMDKEEDYEAKRLQFTIEIGGGVAQTKVAGDSIQDYWGDFDESDFMPDLALGMAYRIFRSSSDASPAVDILICGSAGVNMVYAGHDFDADDLGDNFRVLLTAAPEVGVRFPVGSSKCLRPFGSFGPGLSILNPDWFEDDLMLVWILRFGLEIQTKGPLSYLIGAKLIFRGDHPSNYDWMYDDAIDYNEKDYLGFFGLRVKI